MKKKCKSSPCHKHMSEHFDCMLCYCPLYEVDCAGNYKLVGDHLIKDCTDCVRPHTPAGKRYIVRKLQKMIPG
jgi:Zn-finger protein